MYPYNFYIVIYSIVDWIYEKNEGNINNSRIFEKMS